MENLKPLLELPEFVYRQAVLAKKKLREYAIENDCEYEDIFVTEPDIETTYTPYAQDLFDWFFGAADDELLEQFRKGA